MAKKKEQPSKRRRTTVRHEELAPGTVLTARVKGRELSASVVTGPEGTSEVEFEGTRYPSLSVAGVGRLTRAVCEGPPSRPAFGLPMPAGDAGR